MISRSPFRKTSQKRYTPSLPTEEQQLVTRTSPSQQHRENYSKFYRDFCVKRNIQINNSILHSLKSDELALNIDLLEKIDLQSLKEVFSHCTFTTIKLFATQSSISQEIQQKSQGKQRTGTPIVSNHSSKQLLDNNPIPLVNNNKTKVNQQPLLFAESPQCTTLFRLVASHILKSQQIEKLFLSHLKAQYEHLRIIGQALEFNDSLKEFHVNFCGLSSRDVQAMAPGISKNTSLLVIDFSANLLCDNVGTIVGQILSAHTQRRDDIIWLFSLRGEEPNQDISQKGICEVNLAFNQLNKNCVRDLCYFLQFDGWTRSINLRGNLIDEEGVCEVLNVLKNNQSLISLDLRENQGFNQGYSDFIFNKLIHNIEIFKTNRYKYTQHTAQSVQANRQHNFLDEEDEYGQREGLFLQSHPNHIQSQGNFYENESTNNFKHEQNNHRSYSDRPMMRSMDQPYENNRQIENIQNNSQQQQTVK